MREISATELARQLREVLDWVEHRGEEVLITRNKQKIARLLPGPGQMTALQALSDLYRTLPEDAGQGWLQDARSGPSAERLTDLKDRWE